MGDLLKEAIADAKAVRETALLNAKAAYKRERFLAREFIKHLNTKSLDEQRLRKAIRKILNERG